MNSGQYARPGGVTLALCQPFLVNAAIFTGLILVDVFNSQKDLIPFHAVIGIILTLLTLVLCSYNYAALSWVLAIVPGIFLAISGIYALTQNRYFIAAERGIGRVYDTTLNVANKVRNELGEWSDQAVDSVNSINTYGQQAYKETSAGLRDTVGSINNAWNRAFNAQVEAGVDPAKAAVIASAATGTTPDAGTAAAATASAAIASAPSVTITGEYLYLCGDGTDPKSAPPDSMADQCKYVNQQCASSADPDCYDKLIGVVNAPSVCLGMLATGGTAPSYNARNNCLACDPKLDPDSLKLCRCTAMNTCPTSVMGSTAGMVAAPAAAMPVAATAQAFTNYGGW